jgi:hypothetical protein
MPGLGRVYEALARQAREEHLGFEEYLHEVLAAEQSSRLESAVRHRLREARFPEMKTLDTFDFAATDGAINAAQIAELARGEWIKRADNVIFADRSGRARRISRSRSGLRRRANDDACSLHAPPTSLAYSSKREMLVSWDAFSEGCSKSISSCSTSSVLSRSIAQAGSCSSTC